MVQIVPRKWNSITPLCTLMSTAYLSNSVTVVSSSSPTIGKGVNGSEVQMTDRRAVMSTEQMLSYDEDAFAKTQDKNDIKSLENEDYEDDDLEVDEDLSLDEVISKGGVNDNNETYSVEAASKEVLLSSKGEVLLSSKGEVLLSSKGDVMSEVSLNSENLGPQFVGRPPFEKQQAVEARNMAGEAVTDIVASQYDAFRVAERMDDNKRKMQNVMDDNWATPAPGLEVVREKIRMPDTVLPVENKVLPGKYEKADTKVPDEVYHETVENVVDRRLADRHVTVVKMVPLDLAKRVCIETHKQIIRPKQIIRLNVKEVAVPRDQLILAPRQTMFPRRDFKAKDVVYSTKPIIPQRRQATLSPKVLAYTQYKPSIRNTTTNVTHLY